MPNPDDYCMHGFYKGSGAACPQCKAAIGLFMHVTPKCDHDWSGPEMALDRGNSTSCAKCGKLAIEDVW